MKLWKIEIRGRVQGVGMRPTVHRLATKCSLTGTVRNLGGMVRIHLLSGKEEAEAFCRRIREEAPKRALLREITMEETDEAFPYASGFHILSSEDGEGRESSLPGPDFAICENCRREMRDPLNRRYRHAFISCTDCGPRYSIMESLPYDRGTIRMRVFPLCPSCREEYEGEASWRFHAETIACRECGPVYTLRKRDGELFREDSAAEEAVRLLAGGGILLLKSTSGFHLVTNAENTESVKRLRRLKGREEKSFAILVGDALEEEVLTALSEKEREAYLGTEAPILLIEEERLPELKERLSPEVGRGSRFIGCMRSSHGMQLLLSDAFPLLVMTSANLTEEPLIYKDEDAERYFASSGEIEGLLIHDREILRGADDGVLRFLPSLQSFLRVRRSRGRVPEPLPLPEDVPGGERILALGGDLKATFAFLREREVFFTRPHGDLEKGKCEAEYTEDLQSMTGLFEWKAERILRDAHPSYVSHLLAEELEEDLPIRDIYHHEAHAMMALYGRTMPERSLVLCFDGTGYGRDGIIRGSEVYLWENRELKHLTSLAPVLLPGGDESSRNALRVLYGYLYAGGEVKDASSLPGSCSMEEKEIVFSMLRSGLFLQKNTGMGRLFDGVSALLGFCEKSTYEGEAAGKLERAAFLGRAGEEEAEEISLRFPLEGEDLLSPATLISFLNKERETKENTVLALAFHKILARSVLRILQKVRKEGERLRISLAGGCFHNECLIECIKEKLKDEEAFLVLPEEFSPGDEGLAMGQILYDLLIKE